MASWVLLHRLALLDPESSRQYRRPGAGWDPGGNRPEAVKMTETYRSEAFAAIHETMEALHDVGAIDKQTMREFDAACLTPVRTLVPEEIRAIREREHLSQPVFARYLNVSKNLISDWERGVKKPGGPALRLLTIVREKGIGAIA
jgi:putative transcriptional regulator